VPARLGTPDGFEWCYDPLRKVMPGAELALSALWTLLFLASSLTFALRMPALHDVVGDPALARPRAAVAFAFAATLAWAGSAVLAWRRHPRHPSPAAAGRYRAVATSAVGES